MWQRYVGPTKIKPIPYNLITNNARRPLVDIRCSMVLRIRNRIQVLNCKKIWGKKSKNWSFLHFFYFLHIMCSKLSKIEDDFTLFAKCDILSLRNFSEKWKQWIQIQIRTGTICNKYGINDPDVPDTYRYSLLPQGNLPVPVSINLLEQLFFTLNWEV